MYNYAHHESLIDHTAMVVITTSDMHPMSPHHFTSDSYT